MKRCPTCKTIFPDDANFCPMHAERLVSGDASPPAAGAPKGAAAPTGKGAPAADAASTMFGYQAFGGAPGSPPMANAGGAAAIPAAGGKPPTASASPAPAAAHKPAAASPSSAAHAAPIGAGPAHSVPAAAPLPPPPAAIAAVVAKGKGKGGAEKPPPSQKGKFRETLWFKKGELDEAAAAAAAATAAAAAAKGVKSADALPVSDKADEMPMEDRYKDDGSVTAADRERLSLRTGSTQLMPAVKSAPAKVPGEQMAEVDIVEEMRAGRKKAIAMLMGALVLLAVVITYFAMSGGKKEQTHGAITGDAGAPAIDPARPVAPPAH